MMLTDGIATVVRGQTVPFILDRLGGNMENEIVPLSFKFVRIENQIKYQKLFSSSCRKFSVRL